MPLSRPLRVHVCIDQELSDAPQSGLLRTWFEFWRAAARHPDVDITGHALGPSYRITRWSENVRIVQHPVPALSTAALERVGLAVPAKVGFWPHHRALAGALEGADVIHTTHTLFSFAMTGLRVSRREGIPLVSSLQTLVPQHAEIYARAVGGKAFGGGVRRAFDAQTRWYFGQCSHVLLSSDSDRAALPAGFAEERVVRLSRGIDRAWFHPSLRDPRWLRETFGIRGEGPVLLYVGKVRPEKNVLTLARALRLLLQESRAFTLLVCGEGDQERDLQKLLGDRVVLAGVQPHETLRRIYASSDLLAFPSTTESYGQVIMEAMCSGLPVVISALGGSAQHVAEEGIEGVRVPADRPEAWAAALRPLLDKPQRLRWMGEAARRRAERTYRTWGEIFEETIVRVWSEAARRSELQLPSDAPS